MRVKRKNGKEEDFIREKIVVAIIKSGGKVDTAREVAQEVERALTSNRIVTTEQIRTEVLNRLMTKDRKAYDGWLEYDRKNKRTA
jgi:transcriptional regulator NrdR family protein